MDTYSTRYAALGGIIRADLKRCGISVREAARRTGIPETTLNRRLAGEAFRLHEIEALAAICGTSAAQWLARLDSAAVAA